jgi:hypothetical protein
LLTFLKKTVGIEPSALYVADLDAPPVLRFLDDLEYQRGNAVRLRNIRLSALRDPESVAIATRVIAIPLKRADKKLVG